MTITETSPESIARTIQLVVFDFDGVFTDNTVWTNAEGVESVRCWRSDGLGLQKLPSVGISAYVLSSEENPVVSARCKKLKLPCKQGLKDKQAALQALSKELNISLSQVAYVGNDINDIGCLEIAGLPIVVQDAYPEVVKLALYQTDKPGGFGAVREVCDWLISMKAVAKEKDSE